MIHIRHRWELIETLVASPSRGEKLKGIITEDTMQKLVFGVTTYLYRCVICTELKTVEILGTKQVYELAPQLNSKPAALEGKE